MLFHVCCVACHSVGWTRPRGLTKKNGGLTNQPLQAAVIFSSNLKPGAVRPSGSRNRKKISDFSNLTLIRPLKTMTSLDHWIHTYKIHGMFFGTSRPVQLQTLLGASQLPVNQAVQNDPTEDPQTLKVRYTPGRLTAGT